MILSVNVLDAVAPRLSVTCTVNVKDPCFVGVPVIAPEVLKLNPGASEPDVMLQLYGAVPPLADSVAE